MLYNYAEIKAAMQFMIFLCVGIFTNFTNDA